MLIGM